MAQFYALRGLETGKIKIGITENFDLRLPSYKTHCAEPLEVLMCFEVGGSRGIAAELEREELEEWKDHLTHGEWLSPSAALLSRIEQMPYLLTGFGSGIHWTDADRAQRDSIKIEFVIVRTGSGRVLVNGRRVAHFSHPYIALNIAEAMRTALLAPFELQPDGSGMRSEAPGVCQTTDESGVWAI